ncbi:hypothetical protein HXX76_006644 [Chlamydomonas incerta]|uniref:AAA+ ATPase domain-containing protein n=1 Tax=Chlamydomonas incerta TaxID=51695 RepID=A0A835TCH5_CHLIN|nr:hypothetical protein HXX76_006644 [Chlamydomonas incerta]|eukprot:KAG2436335.1 hypothetical protein HXX76_006644 [Chlamydomonas incerta]
MPAAKLPPLRGGSGSGPTSVLQQGASGAMPPIISAEHSQRPGTLPPISSSPHGGGAPGGAQGRQASPPHETSAHMLAEASMAQNSLAAIMSIIEPEFKHRIFRGTDVIEYYAKFGHDAKVKMFHCIKANPHGAGSPYDLLVLAKEALPPPRAGSSYYTMSASGVVQIFADGSPAEYTPIGEWVRETSVYNMMKQLPFFRNYMSQRYLRMWRSAARSSHFERLRAKMEGRMLVAKPEFCFTIMDIGAKVWQMQQVELAEVPKEGPVPLAEFNALQDELRKNKAAYHLGNLLVAVERALLRLISDVRKNCEWLTKEVAELERETNPVLAASHAPTSAPSGKPGRSILKAKTEKLEKSKALRQAQQEVSLLVNMVRLADYMCCEGSLALLLRTLEGLRDTFESKAILLTQLSFDLDSPSLTEAAAAASAAAHGGADAGAAGGGGGGGEGGMGQVTFHASEEDVRQALTVDLVDALNEVIKTLPRLPQQESLKPLFLAEAAGAGGAGGHHGLGGHHGGAGSGLNMHGGGGSGGSAHLMLVRVGPEMTTMLMGYRPLQKARLGLGQVVSKAFRDARTAASRYAGMRVIAAFAATFDGNAYRGQQRDVAQFRRDMALLRSWQDDLVAYKAGYDGLLLHLSVSEMQELLSTTLDEAMGCLRLLLTAAAHNTAQTALDEFQGLANNLGGRPQKLDEFAAYYASFTQTMSGKDAIERQYNIVLNMYEMLIEYGGKLPPADQVALDDLKEVVAGFHRALSEASTWVDERRPAMTHALSKAIRDVVDRLQDMLRDLRSGKYDDAGAAPADVLAQLASTTELFESISEKAARYRGYEELFGQQPSRGLDDVEQANKELSAARAKWQSLAEFEESREGWMTSPTSELDPEQVQAKMDDFNRTNYKALKARKDDPVAGRLKKSLDEFQKVLPLLQEVANKALEKRHWDQILTMLGQTDAESFNVQDLIVWGVLDHLEAVSSIGGIATKEASMLKTLDKMEHEWEGLDFRVLPYKDTGAFILGGTDEIQTVLDDQIVKIQAMNASPFVKPFKERASTWEATLQNLQDMLDNWLKCQATWLYLEPIFSSDDIVKQMPEEGDKFRQVDAMWRRMMKNAHHAPAVIPIAREKERLDRLVEANQMLDAIQKGLAAYLEKKRLFFPRFFFLSNDEMLEILSETKDPTRVQPHLKKCFEGINTLTFTPQLVITAMNSVEQESVPFKNPIDTNKARGAVERWLVEVEEAMFASIHDVSGRGLEDYVTRPRHEWVLQWPGMVVLVVTAIFWTSGVEKALKGEGGALKQYEEQCTSDLLRTVDLVRGELTGLQRATLGALVVMDVHARDVVAAMVTKGVTTAADFEWQAQLRSYWEENEAALAHGGDSSGRQGPTVMMRMMSAVLEYGYEYLGNSSRLVITPLTDRCYRTLMGAIHLTLGGAPEGPAGTGKTETTKDLAKALARQCVVFNCSDSLDYQAMGKFFKGLASSGAWACFDEFNRIDLEVLSVVAQQVLDIQRAIHARVRRFTFEGTEMQLKWSAWCAITMNPGYAGRSELPDNLKALFRTVAMMVPDYAMISEIILYSNGYLKARDCAKKIVQCYKLCSEQLSSQDHYDYGMRAVMAVLRAAGNLKRRFPSEDEYVLMLRSIIDVNLCKFLSHDVPLFNGIISDLFPGVVLPKPDYAAMETALKEACVTHNLQPTEYFLLKSIQLYEMIVVRHGLMIVGLPFAGKTSSYRVLADALTIMETRGEEGQRKAEFHVINPKSITMGQLYGQFDPISHEWTDGVLAVTFRQVASNPEPHRKWLVLDGPVDAIWIENMNTVLDDNKKLCLNSGEIIQMSSSMNMIFEVMDLAVASPATVSRCGMVYLEPHQLGWRPLVVSWLATLPAHMGESHRKHLLGLFDWLVPVSLRFLRRELKESAPTLDANLVHTLMRYITSSIDHLQDEEGYKKAQDKVTLHLESLFLFALVWSVGGSGADNSARHHFDGFVRAAVAGQLPAYKSPSGEMYTMPEDIPEGHVKLKAAQMMPTTIPGSDPPPGGAYSVYDFFFDTAKDMWRPWTELIDTKPIPADAKFRRIIIPSIDTVRYTYLLDKGITHSQPVLICGPTGTGKSVLVQKYLYGLPADKYVPPNIIGFSARTSANSTQHLIDAKLDRRRRGVFGPPMGKQAVVYIDDLNMPQLETYGAQPPIELLRQFMDHGGWYARDNTFRRLDDVLFVGAMGPPGGGRNPITPRYQRHFNLVTIVDFDEPTLGRIFSTLLGWHLDTKSFPANIKELRDPIIAATLSVYTKVASQLLPTPTRSHYTFNLRDISRVMQGFLLLPPQLLGAQPAQAKDKYLRLWAHEIQRVFYDRLVDDKDRSWFLAYLRTVMKEKLGAEFDKLFAHLRHAGAASPEVTIEDVRKCFFGDYMDPNDEPALRLYDEVTDVAALLSRVEELLMDHNATSKRPMNLAVFLYAVEHVSRIARVLKQPGGHLLLVGVGGSGRQSLARLAAFVCGMEAFQVEISKSYGPAEWREDLKRFVRIAGGDNKQAVFLFSDTQIKAESFVEDVNNLLNSGEVPNMFPYDERAAVLEQCRNSSKKEGLDLDSAVDLWAYFVDKTRDNLHIVLAFSPIGDAFRERLRQFPSLVNCCTIDWFTAWPDDALEAVAMKFLREVDLTSDQRNQVMLQCKMFHEDVRHLSDAFKAEQGRINYVTPTSYLELITCFTNLLGAKRAEVSAAKRRYEVGLEKLNFTAGQVSIMQDELTALKPVLIKTVAETERLMATVSKEKTEVVEPKKAIVDEDVKKAEASAAAANAIKTECEDALAEAIPILEAAISALDTIKPADIKLVQSFKNPPGVIKTVMEAVCVLLDIKPQRVKDPGGSGKMIDDYWGSAQKLLADPKFVQTLKEYDKDSVPPKIIERIRRDFTSNPEFTPAIAAKASSAAEGLCKWVCAMDSYDKVAKVVAPKRAALAEAEAEYAKVMEALKAKQADLAEVMGRLATLEEQLEKSMAEKVRLEAETELCTAKLERAEKLISGLGGEKTRWTEAAAKMGSQYDCLTGDMLIAAGVIGYLGAFTAAYREQMVGKWVAACAGAKIPRSATFSLSAALGDPVKVRGWTIDGLPNDAFSIDNAIMVDNGRRWPLMIDPQSQANKWIKAMEGRRDLRVIKLTDGDYMRTLENAVQFGLPVLLENVGEELDPSLEPLLLKQVFKQGGLSYLRLGDTTVEFSDQFRFYITTALRNPHYLPETAVKVTLLNFMITPDGLADQLLGVVVAQERPDLEEQRQQLVVESAENKKKLSEIEDRILHVLSSSQGNILEDATAIQILSEAKAVSNEIQIKQEAAEVTQKAIDEARTGYAPCGAFNATLFFCIRDMAAVDPMYQYSLAWFLKLFVRSIQQATKADDVAERLKHINDHFTYALYQNICRSLFEKDKLLYAFLLASRILMSGSESKLDPHAYAFLLTGGVGVPEREVTRPSGADWLSAKAWGELCRAPNISPGFEGLPELVAGCPDEWKTLFDSVEPQNVDLPLGYSERLGPFEKVLLLRMLRPDKVVPAVQHFVASSLGSKFTEPPPFDLAGSYEESSCTVPLLFVLSPGSDPTAALLQFAESRGYGSKISVISMGQGQGPKAAALIEAARKAGTWVLLQNCHLAPSWMTALEKICESIKPDNTDADFRLWMTSMPSPAFPVSILQGSVKMTNEPPAGLRANLRRSYALEPICNQEFFEGCRQPKAFKSLLFGLCFLHAFVQERRKFGPIGWNIPYGFDDGDLRISVRQLSMYLDDAAPHQLEDGSRPQQAVDTVPFAALQYAIGECNYGGRVTDDKDRRLLLTALQRIYRPAALVLDTDKPFALSASGTYVIPPEGPHASYLDYIATLPVFPLPEAFGLHENADITKDLQNTNLMLDTLVLTGGGVGGGAKGGGGGGGGASDEEMVAAMVEDVLKRLPPNFDIEKAQSKYPVRYEESLNQVLCQEMLRYNRLLAIIRSSLINLSKALSGLQVLSSELDTVLRSMALGQVPALWRDKSFPSLKPLASYVADLLARLDMLQSWYEHGPPPVFWLSGFFFTPSFTTAALQNYARKHKLPIDTVGFDFVMMGTDPAAYTEPPEDGVFVHGLFLEGCAWDASAKQLCESRPKVLFENAPVIWLQPRPADQFGEYEAYDCPVYRTAERKGVLATTGHSTNFLMMIRLPSQQPQYHWTLRGVCMLCSLSD